MIVNDNHIWQAPKKHHKVHVCVCVCVCVCVGMLRWTLHNRVDKNPSISVPLLRVLIKELEKVCSSVLLSGYRHQRFLQ